MRDLLDNCGRWRRWYALALAATILMLARPGLAWDSPAPKSPVPPHAGPWVEMKAPDLRTVFLWKFASDADRDAEAGAILDAGALEDAGDRGDTGALADKPENRAPKLHGNAKVVAATGRFGGGLQLDGRGYAETGTDWRVLLDSEGGFTLDFWFRYDGRPAADTAATLASIPDRNGQPLLTVTRTPAATVSLAVAGQVRLEAPCRDTADGWHHLALVISAPRGQPDHAALAFTLDGDTARGDKADPFNPIPWFKGVPKRFGNVIRVGGVPGGTGLHGVLDEVRLSKGVRYLYPWNLGLLERVRSPQALEMKAPFFKERQVLTRFRFDGELKPEAFAGQSWTGRTEAAGFQPGVSGRALDLSQIDKSGFAMKGFYILPEKEGTVEFWFRPLDWNNFYVGEYDGRDVPYQWLMTLTAKDALYASPSKNTEVIKGRACRDADLRWQQIHPGTWTHVLISVKDGGPTVYVNGRLQKLWQVGLVIRGHPHAAEPLKKWRDRTGGRDVDDIWTLAFVKSPTLIDEFSVYSAAMASEEAWNAYARWLPDAATQMKPLPVFRVDFEYYAHSWDMKEKLVLRLACLPVGDTKPASADIEIRAATTSLEGERTRESRPSPASLGPVLLAVDKQPLDATGCTAFTLDRVLPFGRYPVTVRSRTADGAVLKEEKQEYVREKPEWLGNTLGEDRSVPPPWTPIAVEGRKVRLINRELELGANGLPTTIETLKQPVLAAPVTVRAGGVELTGQGPTFTETAPDRVAWKAALTGGGLAAELDAWLEFDGLIYCAITLKPAAGATATVEDLDVDFPITPAAATQLLANGGGNDFRSSWIAKPVPAFPASRGSVDANGDANGERLKNPRNPPSSPPSSTGSASPVQVWNSLETPYPSFCRAFEVTNFMPNIWLGNDDVGLYFGAENDQGWTVDGPKPAQEILRQGGAVVMRLNIIREPTPIPAAGRRFHFVLLSTPAKPEPADWRKQMTDGGVNFGSCDTFGGFDLKTDPADANPGDCFRLEPRSWEHAAKQAPQCRAKWGRCILYADASFPGLGPAFRDWSHNMWADTGKLAWTPEFEDYAVWAINEYIKRGLIDGIYWDDVSVGSTLLLRGGAYEYAGSPKGRRVGFTALAQRRVNMRLWRLFEATGKEPCIWAHMTVCYEVPLFSFCRYLSNCEFVTGVELGKPRDAMDMWAPETLRLLGGAAKWGTGYSNLSTLPRTLPDTAVAKQWAYPQQRTETALYLTSDQWGPPDGLGQVLTREQVFDGPVQAYPWWKAAEVLKVTAPEAARPLAGVYACQGRAIVLVANRDRGGEHEFTLAIETAKLFPSTGAGVAWRDLDPRLKPPATVMAGTKEINDAGAAVGDAAEPGGKPMTEDATTDLLDGTTTEGRALKRLELRTEGNSARIVVRPRDYRVLEVKPR